MSKRTSEALKAIRQAWEKEQALVLEGKGTRDWTPEQQISIVEQGKAYDDDGRAFDGQHMLSVEAYPEYQGNPDNIQFLTRQEHLDAHDGNWQNPTKWYYNPITKEKTIFENLEEVKCPIIELSYPKYKMAGGSSAESESNIPYQKKTSDTNDNAKESDEPQKNTDFGKLEKLDANSVLNGKTQKSSSFFAKAKANMANSVKHAKSFIDNPIVRKNVGKGLAFVTKAATVAVTVISVVNVAKASSNGGQHESIESISDTSIKPNKYSNLKTPDTINTGEDEKEENKTDVDESVISEEKEERSAPKEHIVQRHKQTYHTNNGPIVKEKEPYPRGGKGTKE